MPPVEFKDADPAKQNVNKTETTNKTTGVYRKDADEVVRKIDELLTNEKESDKNVFRITNAKITNGLFSETKCVGGKTRTANKYRTNRLLFLK